MPFDLPPELVPIHQPTRLRVMALLHRERDVGFAAARDALELTAGNLGAHAQVLEACGFLVSRQALQRNGFQVRYKLTEAGAIAFRRYLEALESFLRGARE